MHVTYVILKAALADSNSRQNSNPCSSHSATKWDILPTANCSIMQQITRKNLPTVDRTWELTLSSKLKLDVVSAAKCNIDGAAVEYTAANGVDDVTQLVTGSDISVTATDLCLSAVTDVCGTKHIANNGSSALALTAVVYEDFHSTANAMSNLQRIDNDQDAFQNSVHISTEMPPSEKKN